MKKQTIFIIVITAIFVALGFGCKIYSDKINIDNNKIVEEINKTIENSKQLASKTIEKVEKTDTSYQKEFTNMPIKTNKFVLENFITTRELKANTLPSEKETMTPKYDNELDIYFIETKAVYKELTFKQLEGLYNIIDELYNSDYRIEVVNFEINNKEDEYKRKVNDVTVLYRFYFYDIDGNLEDQEDSDK